MSTDVEPRLFGAVERRLFRATAVLFAIVALVLYPVVDFLEVLHRARAGAPAGAAVGAPCNRRGAARGIS